MEHQILVLTNTGESLSKTDILNLIRKAGDEFYQRNVIDIDVKCGEHPEDAVSGYATLTVDADLEGMLVETQWYLDAVFSREVAPDVEWETVEARPANPA